MNFHLTQSAYKDLLEIARFTEAEWGINQRNAYLAQFDDCFNRISAQYALGQACDALRPGYRKLRSGRHIIYYRRVPTTKEIEIVRVLHERMDADAHIAAGETFIDSPE